MPKRLLQVCYEAESFVLKVEKETKEKGGKIGFTKLPYRTIQGTEVGY